MGDRFLTRKVTKERRKSQVCRVFELKIDESKLSKATQKHLYKLFIEAKWFYNYVVSQKNINDARPTITKVPVKIGDIFEERDLSVLKSHMKQGLKVRAFNGCKALKALKENGHRIGRLKFKRQVNSIMLQEYKRTFGLDFKRSRVRIQGLKPWLRVSGLEQIVPEMEVANAHLVRKSSGYYLNVTTYESKQERHVPEQAIGIDFGCETQLTLSDGIKLEFQVPISKRLRKLDRKINRKQSNGQKRPPSKKKRQDQIKRQKSYECLTNRKKDIRNKIVSAITKNYRYVIFQDESIHAWHAGGHGKKVQHSGIGAILRDLKNKSCTPIMVNKFFPSTQLCPQCGTKNKMPEWKRVYECECGFKEDRDVKSAYCILEEGLKEVPMDCRDLVALATIVAKQQKARESVSSTYFDSIAGIKVSKMCSMN